MERLLSLRLCRLCDLDEIEDEIHFLCDCPRYHNHNHRLNLFEKACNIQQTFSDMDIIDKFLFLLSHLQRQVADFLLSAVSTRNNILYI